MTTGGRARGESGDTLLEVIISLALMGIAVVTIISSIASAVSLSVVHRGQTDVSAALVSAAEYLKSESYAPCCGTAGCGGVQNVTPPDPQQTFGDDLQHLALAQQDVTAPVVYRVTDASGSPCSGLSSDPGLEMIWIQATGGGGRVTQTMYVIKGERS